MADLDSTPGYPFAGSIFLAKPLSVSSVPVGHGACLSIAYFIGQLKTFYGGGFAVPVGVCLGCLGGQMMMVCWLLFRGG